MESFNAIDEQTRVLAKEFVYYFAKNIEPQSEIGSRMRQCVDRLTKESAAEFDRMISSIDLRKENAVEMLLVIATSMFKEDGNWNWGRVTALLTFAGFAARKLTPEGDENFLDMFATAFGNYLAKTISEWISEQGGWDTFRSTTGTGVLGYFGPILCLGVGVAAAYTTLAAMR